MTLTTTTRTVTFTGNGSTTEFAFSFKIPAATDLVVQTFDTVSLATATISSSDYSVTGIGDASGGTVTYPLSGSPIASTIRITLTRTVAFTQVLDIQNQDGFNPDAFEDQLDLIVMQVQQLAFDIGVTVKAPVGDNITDFTLPLDAARAEKYLFFASDGSVGVTGTAPAIQYQGAFTTGNEPTLRLGGTALVTGDLYFNTTSDLFKVYNGSSWITAVTSTAVGVSITDSGSFFVGTEVEAALQEVGPFTVPSIVAGDVFYGSGNTTVARLAKGTDGKFLQLVSGIPAWTSVLTVRTPIVTTSGTAHAFTGIAAGASRITMMLDNVSLSGVNGLIVEIGDSGGFETTNYFSRVSEGANDVVSTSAFIITSTTGAGENWDGVIVLTHLGSNTWVMSGNIANHSGGEAVQVSAGGKTLSAELTQVQLTRNGSNTFDSGKVNILIE